MVDQCEIGAVQTHLNANRTRILKYSVELRHHGLNEHKILAAPDQSILQTKATIQMQKWEEKWQSVQTKMQREADKEANAEEASSRTDQARRAVEEIENLLVHVLTIDSTIVWGSLKLTGKFGIVKPGKPKKGDHKPYPERPKEEAFSPKLTLIDKLMAKRRERKIGESKQRYASALSTWEEDKLSVDKANAALEKSFDRQLSEWEKRVEDWTDRRKTFLAEQRQYNDNIDSLKDQYSSKDKDAILEYCELVLTKSEYPASFPKSYALEYTPENGILVIEYSLPSQSCFPTVKEVRYLSSRKELKESTIPEAQQSKMFDDAMYKIALRTLHELFKADKVNALVAVAFNGWVKSVNKATGKEETNCILSIQVTKEEFVKIDLANVDPKVCFRNLKGVSASKLSTLTPIQPIMQISRADKRFVEAYAVVESVDPGTNLAAMDWEDFEHLIRELFEKEFRSSGGEVKITQASRDGGVDAIAFDPDPIRGGKIVIQAKRYTNTVGVSAVRDLFGTVHNEGATKGILVSTADFGPDAYEFAKGKPLTLLNGSHLLHLLQKHGHHARIDLREAKKVLAERNAEQSD